MCKWRCVWAVLAHAGLAAALWGGTFGRVVPIGGHASDLALDEARGVAYVANFTASQIEVISLAGLTRQASMAVAPQPASLAVSPDGRFLVVTHYSNFQSPANSFVGLTLVSLDTGARQAFPLASPPLGVAFTSDNRALVVTTTGFLIYDPATGALTTLETIEGLAARTLPVPPLNFPPQITATSMASSRDGERVYGLTDTFRFRFDRHPRRLTILGYVSEPPLGPRVVSVNRDGSAYAAGWALFDQRGTLMAQFHNPSGLLNVGSHAIDSERGLIYAQIPSQAGEPPVLMVADADNLTVRERFRLPENLAGKALLSSDGATMYAVSDSGMAALPVGAWERQSRLSVTEEEVFFQSDFCDNRALTREIFLVDGAGGQLDYKVTVSTPGVTVSPTTGSTPAGVLLRFDPSAFTGPGTREIFLNITSNQAVNLPLRVRVLVNLRQPDQRGTLFHVPGLLADLVPDPMRNRFYVLRQDRNQVLVYDGTGFGLLATLRTGNTPTQMTFTFDRRYLLVANDNSQIANVFDLETLKASDPIRFPGGHYPRSIAASGRAILAASRVAGPKNTIDRVDFNTRTAAELATLGVYENNIHMDTVLTAAANGSSILAAQADGNLLLYDANTDTFTISRKDSESLGGAYAASNYDWFVVGGRLLNASLVPVATFETSGGAPSGFVAVGQSGILAVALAASAPGSIQRFDLLTGGSNAAVRLVDAPLAGSEGAAFTRTLAALPDHSALISLGTAGVTVLAWSFDAATAPPGITSVVSAADFTAPVAPGGLITLFGSGLSPLTVATSELPLPRALGEICLLINGVPAPLLFVSPAQINSQMPFETEGNVTLVLHTPGGVSDSYRLSVSPSAPSVFRSGTAGPLNGIPTIVRAANLQLVTPANPVHRGDVLVIYLTGLGRTWPAVESGSAAPLDPLPIARQVPVVALGGSELPLDYAGLTPGLVGVYQINARVPDSVLAGMSVPLSIRQGGSETTLNLRVVQ